jgi:NAD(P)-dependent dehydrogenase (short-subunit alcohol dehydrogenase family)
MSLFPGRVAIVTGAGAGLGRATARLLAREEAQVACVDIVAETAIITADEIVAGGGRAVAYTCDVSDPRAVKKTVERIADDLGRPSVVCNVAGIQQWSHTMELSIEDWGRILAVNLTGTFLVCQAALGHLADRGGAIVNVASTAGIRGLPYAAAYCASKGGVVQLTRSLAFEYAQRGVRVNAVAPGGMETAMLNLPFPPNASQALLGGVRGSLVGVGAPEAVASVVAFLASDDAAHMNGAIVPVDGGGTL